MAIERLAIIGVGLIGASIGLAARRRGLARVIAGFGRDPVTLDRARCLRALDEPHLELGPAVAGADVVVFCTPVNVIPAQVLAAAACCPAGVLLTDAGSTKQRIVERVERELPSHVDFVGAHPLAGSEKRGAEHGDPDLFQDRWTVITRTARTDPAVLDRAAAFWEGLGSRVTIMNPAEHDRALALTSHLPHLAAAALAGLLPTEWQHLAATGWRDTTRIAAGDPALWLAIFDSNRDAVLNALEQFEQRLLALREALVKHQWTDLFSLLDQAKKVRDALGS